MQIRNLITTLLDAYFKATSSGFNVKFLLFLVAFITSTQVFAGFEWTQQNWQGKGVTVKSVYIHWEKRWVSFSASNGKSYYYAWGQTVEPTLRARLLHDTLLVAFSAEKRLSIYSHTTPSSNGWHKFTYLNLHD